MQQTYGVPSEDPMQYEPSGEARHPRDSTRYETWTSKQLRKKCSHLKLRGLKNVKKHAMVEAFVPVLPESATQRHGGSCQHEKKQRSLTASGSVVAAGPLSILVAVAGAHVWNSMCCFQGKFGNGSCLGLDLHRAYLGFLQLRSTSHI